MPVSDFSLPFVGRSGELKALKTFYDRGWHRGAGFMLLYGRKGIGKTRLLQQFLQGVAIASLRVRHTLAEPSLHFYYQQLKPTLNQLSPRETAVAAWTSLNESLGQEPFVALCREWAWAAAITQQLDILPQKVGVYWDDQTEAPEFPIAVADLWKKKLLVGASLWNNGRFTPADLEELIQKMHLLPQAKIEE